MNATQMSQSTTTPTCKYLPRSFSSPYMHTYSTPSTRDQPGQPHNNDSFVLPMVCLMQCVPRVCASLVCAFCCRNSDI
eukprot:2362684-Prymnesium_polylepis.2